MSKPSPLRGARALLCVALTAGVSAGLFEIHTETSTARPASGQAIVVELAATHAASAAHVEAAGAREARRCDLCAQLARTGSAIAQPPLGIAPAAAVASSKAPAEALPAFAAARGSSRGRAPPRA